MLQQFLNNSFILISEDENLTKLKKACDEVVKKISKDRAKIVAFTMAGIDPEIPPTNGAILEVQEIVVKHWNTFVSNTKDSPITVIRALILEALETIAKDQNNACLIWNTSRNVIKYYNLGREKDLIVEFLTKLGNEIETSASNSWALPSEANLEKLKVELEEIAGVKIDTATLQKKLEDASGPHNASGTPNYEGPNPHWPNAAQNWSYQFAPRAAKGIAEVVNKALKEQATSLTNNQTKIQEAINKLLTKTQDEILQKNRLLQMRTHLLWWKEACYSPSLKKSYRDVKGGMLEILLANDYSTFVPHVYPASADFFLLEFHKTLATDSKKKLSEHLNTIKQNSAALKNIFPEPTIDSTRVSLLNLIKGYIWDKCSLTDAKNLIGISDDLEISFSDLVLWLFHDSLAFKITQIK